MTEEVNEKEEKKVEITAIPPIPIQPVVTPATGEETKKARRTTAT